MYERHVRDERSLRDGDAGPDADRMDEQMDERMENPDDLWPPFGPQATAHADRAHRLLHERARALEAREQTARGRRGRDQRDRDQRGGDQRERDQRGGDQHGGEQHGGDQRGGEQRGGEQHGGDQHGGEQRGGDQQGARSGGNQRSGGQRGSDQRGRGRGRIAPTLSRGEIVDAAIAVADAEGADAVSMRRIAQVLRSGTMSLYWHVANKEHLLDLMLDTLVGEVTIPDPPGDWRSFLQATARENRAMLLRHRWVMDFIGGRPPLGPNTILNVERSLAALDGLHLDTATAMNILTTVSTYVMGAALRELREIRAQRDLERSGFDTAEAAAGMAEWCKRLQADGRFSHFLRIIEDNVDPDAEETRDERFEFGLDCMLDGIAMQVERRTSGAADRPAKPADRPAKPADRPAVAPGGAAGPGDPAKEPGNS
jgi:AcrR family transcriptional regulator